MPQTVLRSTFTPDPDMYPFTSNWWTHQDARLHYVDNGAGTPVVMLHGNPTWSFLYRDVIRRLPAGIRALAPDLPGFGLSDHPKGYDYRPETHAEWLSRWLNDTLGDTPFYLVVHDWGGPIGMRLALDRVPQLRGLVIINTWCWPPNWHMRVFSRLMGSSGLGKRLQLHFNFFARGLVPLAVYHKQRMTPAVRRHYADPFSTAEMRMGTWVFPRAIIASSSWLAALASRLPALIDIPAELVFGMRDPAFGNEGVIAKWRGILPKANVTKLADASHYVPDDRPDAVADAIQRLIG